MSHIKRCICAIFSPLTRPLTCTDSFCHTYEWVMPLMNQPHMHVCMSHVTYAWGMAHTWMFHPPHLFYFVCLSHFRRLLLSLSLSLSLFLSLSLSFSLSFTLSLFFSLCLSLSLCIQIRLRRILFKWANEIECIFFCVFAYIDRVIKKDR